MSDAATAVRLERVPSPAGAVEPGAARPSRGSAANRAHFIPVSRYGLRAKLVEMLKEDGGDERQWQRALDCLAAWRHQQYRVRLLDLLEDYLPFSPDSDTANLIEYDNAGTEKARREFIDGVETLLIQANYVRLEADDLRRILAERSPHGLSLQVDLSEFDDLVLYYRGVDVAVEQDRDPWRLFLKTNHVEVRIFQRLFLMLKLKPSDVRIAEIMATKQLPRDKAERMVRARRRHLPIGVAASHIYVKVFKRIPQVDLEMLFPNTKIAFKPLDKVKLLVTCGGGTAAGVMGTATKILAATNPFTLAFGLLGFSAVVFRQVMNFFNTRNRYMMVLAQNLYFCSLANNRGALTLIADAAEEEDVKEDMLLYTFLAKGSGRGARLDAIKEEIGKFLSERCGVDVSFDADDALARLITDGIVRKEPKGTLFALGADAAQVHLDRRWDRLLDVDTLDGAPQARGTA
jgi:Protein of unknown function (DUF3754)